MALLSQALTFFCSVYCSDLVALIPGSSSESPVELREVLTPLRPCPTSALIYLASDTTLALVGFTSLFCCVLRS